MRIVKMVAVVLATAFLPLWAFAGDGFPDFITSNEDYYVTRIGKLPDVKEFEYSLEITGLIDKPGKFNLKELRALSGVEIPLTIECIGNSRGGPLL